MKTPEEIRKDLQQFYGTEQWHRWNPMFRTLLTDGAKYVMEACEAVWLMDMIASMQSLPEVAREAFQVWKFQRNEDGRCHVICEDGNYNVIERFDAGTSDFPLDTFDLWFQNNTILLPSEY